MKHLLRLFLLSLMAGTSPSLMAQEHYGMSQSNWSPARTMLYNPASLVDSKVMLDVHIGGFGTFFHTNYAYYDGSEYSFLKHGLLRQTPPYPQFNLGRPDYSVYTAVEFQGPSASFQYKNHGFGLQTRFRTFAEARNVPEIFANMIELPYIQGQSSINPNILGKSFTEKNINIGAMSIGEVGLSYANVVQHFDRNLIVVGGGVKYLFGAYGGGIHIDEFTYGIDSSGVLNYTDIDATTATGFADASTLTIPGNGFSFDFGVVYKRMLDNVNGYSPFLRDNGCRVYNYKWKLGLSLVDLGYVNYKRGSEKQTVQNATGSISDLTSLQLGLDPRTFLGGLFGIDDTQISEDTSFTMVTPAAFIMQYDFNLEKNNMFFSVEFMQGLKPRGLFGIKRPQVLMFTPRYETRRFEFAMPFGMYNLQEVRLGAAMRLGPITIGTDKLGSVLSLTNLTGLDFYVHAAVKLIQDKRCGKRRVW